MLTNRTCFIFMGRRSRRTSVQKMSAEVTAYQSLHVLATRQISSTSMKLMTSLTKSGMPSTSLPRIATSQPPLTRDSSLFAASMSAQRCR